MIRYITRDTLDLEKYDMCIANALNARVYAYSWYLDIVADKKWDVLVLDDYVAVMPLPKRRKYFINYVYQPPWSQQLGVFSLNEINNNLVEKFINAIPKKFKLVAIFLNAQNSFKDENIKERTNYILSLNKSYNTLFKNYKKGRKSSVKQAVKLNSNIIEDYNYSKIIELFKVTKGGEIEEKIDYSSLSKLIEYGLSLNCLYSIGVTNTNNDLIGGALFLKNNNRITYLFSSINKEGREKQVMSLVLDFIIQKFSNKDYVLDFEGSMMNKIALFFRSFGAEKEIYFQYKKYSLL